MGAESINPLPGVQGGTSVAMAYANPLEKKAAKASSSLKVTLVALDCLFLGLQPVLVHLSKNAEGKYSFNPVSVNFLTELAKTIFALITLLVLGTGRPGTPMYLSLRSFVVDAHHNRLLVVPALLYAINNYLKFAMQLFFRPTTTKMLGNLKIFTIALLMRLVMKRSFNVIQWEALFLLVAGITVNQLARSCSGALEEALPPLLPAALCTLGTVTVPSAASVYNEFALKKHMDTSVHLQNFFLYFYGMLFNLVAVLVVMAWKGQGVAELFAGQSAVTLLLIVNNAAQGILSSFFYKFADTILKKYSSTIATIFTALMSWALFAHELTVNFIIGVSIVFISMHQFFSFGDKSGKGAPGGPGAPGVGGERPPQRLVYSPSLDHVALAASNGVYARDGKAVFIPSTGAGEGGAGSGPGPSNLGMSPGDSLMRPLLPR
uniref:CMP-sialic acid transporter n=1 Tax=Chlamydomonas leiostraca TaxID=1034604 RepID=A0A7S0RYF6_9CHLO|mmetsp:Transcript_34616/g.87589  ORF Transcript_34616/g.87589 Transcript_34616/m.87589 type:complete len:434 (+) Transcript_34616:264-1565(+)